MLEPAYFEERIDGESFKSGIILARQLTELAAIF